MSAPFTTWRGLARWEVLLAAILIALVWLGAHLSPVFLTAQNFSNLSVAEMEIAIITVSMTLIIIAGEIDTVIIAISITVSMTLIIIAGEIDLSVESMAGLASSVLG